MAVSLPSDWEFYSPSDKINYFNTYGITPDVLRSYGATQEDLDWMYSNGYQVTEPVVEPITQQPSVSIAEPSEYVEPYVEPVDPYAAFHRMGGITYDEPSNVNTFVEPTYGVPSYGDMTGDLEVAGPGVMNIGDYILPSGQGVDLREDIGEDLSGPTATLPAIVDTTTGETGYVLPNAPITNYTYTEPTYVSSTSISDSGVPITSYTQSDYVPGSGGYTDLGGYDDVYEPNIPATGVVVDPGLLVGNEKGPEDYQLPSSDQLNAYEGTQLPVVDTITIPSGASEGLTYALNNGMTQDQYYNNINDFVTNLVTDPDLTDYQKAQNLINAMTQYGVTSSDIANATGYDVNTVNNFIATPAPVDTSDTGTFIQTGSAGGATGLGGTGIDPDTPEGVQLGLNARDNERSLGVFYSDDGNRVYNDIETGSVDAAGNPIVYRATRDLQTGETTYSIFVDGQEFTSKNRPDIDGNVVYMDDKTVAVIKREGTGTANVDNAGTVVVGGGTTDGNVATPPTGNIDILPTGNLLPVVPNAAISGNIDLSANLANQITNDALQQIINNTSVVTGNATIDANLPTPDTSLFIPGQGNVTVGNVPGTGPIVPEVSVANANIANVPGNANVITIGNNLQGNANVSGNQPGPGNLIGNGPGNANVVIFDTSSNANVTPANLVISGPGTSNANVVTLDTDGNANVVTLDTGTNVSSNGNVILGNANVVANVPNLLPNANIIANVPNVDIIANVPNLLPNANVIANVPNIAPNVVIDGNANVNANVIPNVYIPNIPNLVPNANVVISNTPYQNLIGNINLNTGGYLNPGLIAPTPFYETTSPVQSKFYYGARMLQPGPTFNPTFYNTAPNASATPFGIQNIRTSSLTPQELAQIFAGKNPQRPIQPVARPTNVNYRTVPQQLQAIQPTGTNYTFLPQLPIRPIAPANTLANISNANPNAYVTTSQAYEDYLNALQQGGE